MPPTRSARPRKYTQRTRSSVRVGPCAPTASVTSGAADANAERVDAGHDVPVVRHRLPAHGVRAARQLGQPRDDRALRRNRARGCRDVLAVAREHDDRVRQRRDRLVEAQHDFARRAAQSARGRRDTCCVMLAWANADAGSASAPSRPRRSARLIGAARPHTERGARRPARRRGRSRASPTRR